MSTPNLLFIGIKGRVVALDPVTGTEVWRTNLKGDFVNIVVEKGRLYASTAGKIFCLDPATGTVLWENPLKGLGLGIVSIASTAQAPQSAAAAKRKQEEQAAAAATAASV